MTYLQQINEWSIKHHPRWLVVLRTILGLCLILKGIQFIKDSAVLEQLISRAPVSENVLWLNIFIPWLHLFGGIMIIAGLFTRLSSALQLPILFGAVFFVNGKQSILSGEPGQLFSIIILLLLLLFVVEGGGTFSLDNALRNPKNKLSFNTGK
jgi:uncharacterized membrane protein YphA (DoxX/SURF4 family)